ncbi:integrase [Streptomyces albidoflavus]|uniref:integrase n=1 Tax=Streptomyces albidoflavus TaxID=1886 RepID=UPI003D0CC1AB
MPRDQHVHLEWRGGTCRVKWWSGEYLPNGRKRYESKGGFTDEDEAYQHGLDKLYEIRHGIGVRAQDAKTLMVEWIDDWMETLDVAPLTERRYKASVRNHIRPYWEARRTAVPDVDVLAFRAFKKHIESTAGPAEAQICLLLTGMMLDDAVPRLLRTSPVERKRKRGRHQPKKRERKREMAIESVAQLAENGAEVGGLAVKTFMWTMAMTGARPGELYGLTRDYCYPAWPDTDPRVDPDEEERYADDALRYGTGERMPAIRVERQIQYLNGEATFLPPKYHSYRTLVIPPFLAEMLVELLASHDSRWVFPSLSGSSLLTVNFSYRHWRLMAEGTTEQIRRRDGSIRPVLPPVPAYKGKRLYLVRHGHKEWLDEDGHSRFAVERRMGHEVPGVEGIYSNVTVGQERSIAATLEARYQKFMAAEPVSAETNGG